MRGTKEIWYLVEQDVLVKGVHPLEECRDSGCVVHRPSDHKMRDWPLRFDLITKSFYRICPHDEKHIDPDEYAYWSRRLDSDNKTTTDWAIRKLVAWRCPQCGCRCCSKEVE